MNNSVTTEKTCELVVLISGRGSNMQAIHKACQTGALDAGIALVISNRGDAAGLDYANQHQIPTQVVSHSDYSDRISFDQAVANAIDKVDNPLVVLAGFMRLLSGEFTRRYAGRLLNIHPSLLPQHRGLNTHQRAIDAGDHRHGCSVHYVIEALDGGPVIAQAVVPVNHDDTESSLADRVLSKEHVLYPHVIQLCVSGKIEWRNGHILYCGKRLRNPLLF